MVIKKLLEEYEPEDIIEKKVEKTEEVEKTDVEKIPLLGPEEVIEEVKRGVGRPRLTEEEKREREEEIEREKAARPVPRTPYVGGTPSLEDSGGWCLEESKTVTTTVDRRTGEKKIMINGTEVIRR